jgi:hypothetical protein
VRNYVRPYKAKLPGPSYYRIPFHKELSMFFFVLVSINPGLFSTPIISDSPIEKQP